MAHAGNHGRLVPHDAALLSCMYWDERMTLPEMAVAFGVGHKAVLRVMELCGVPRRRMGPRLLLSCKQCAALPHKIKHPINGAAYGRLCKFHLNEHLAELARRYKQQPAVRAKCKARYRRWYETGAINPKGEEQWLRKSRHLLRTNRRLLATGSPAVSRSRSAASLPGQTSPD